MKGKQMVKAVFSSDRRLLALCCVVFFLCSVLFSMGLWAQEQIVRAMGVCLSRRWLFPILSCRI